MSKAFLKQLIVEEHSKRRKDEIVTWVGKNVERFNILFEFCYGDDFVISQRASYPMSYCVEEHPEFLEKHWDKLLFLIESDKFHQGVKRNSLRAILFAEIPVKYESKLFDLCLQCITSLKDPEGTKANCIHVASKICKKYPELFQEIRPVIQNLLDSTDSAGIKSSCKKLLRS